MEGGLQVREGAEREGVWGKRTVSVLELIAVFRSMIDEANHNWVEGNRTWEDILANEP